MIWRSGPEANCDCFNETWLRPSGKENFECGTYALRGTYADLTAMRADDRSRDEQPEADALCRIVGGSSGQRLENLPLRGKRDRITPIVHAERHALLRAMSFEADRTSTPMLDCVAHQVR